MEPWNRCMTYDTTPSKYTSVAFLNYYPHPITIRLIAIDPDPSDESSPNYSLLPEPHTTEYKKANDLYDPTQGQNEPFRFYYQEIRPGKKYNKNVTYIIHRKRVFNISPFRKCI